MKAVILQHMLSAGPGSFVHMLQQHGFDIEIIHTSHQDIKNFDALAPDLLVIMGGALGVYQADNYPFLHDEMRIIRERVLAGKPYLGICLGAQLLAQAMGGRVYKGTKGPEIGWQPVTLNEAGASSTSPVRHFEDVKVMQWHGDTFDLPPQATLLATSDKYAQIFTIGDHAIGFQCHIEMEPTGIADWLVADVGTFEEHPGLREEFRALTPVCNPLMTSAAEAFMKDWLALNKLI
jgi:GMP synthase (glutamine-hydrolysing)